MRQHYADLPRRSRQRASIQKRHWGIGGVFHRGLQLRWSGVQHSLS